MATMDPTGLLGWAVNKTLDRVVEYVKEAKRYVSNCNDLENLLQRIKPLVSQAISTKEPSSSSTAVDAWLQNSLEPLLKEAEETLQKAMADVMARQDRCTPSFHKKQEHSKPLSTITERIRKMIEGEATLAVLAELRLGISNLELALSTRGLEDQGASVADVQEHPLTCRLWELRRESKRDERCRVTLEIADTHTTRFHIPRHDQDEGSGGASPAVNTAVLQQISDELEGHHRGRVSRGGMEVNNHTKLKITIHVEFEEDWFFYVLFVDHNSSPAQIAVAGFSNAPELYFPTEDLDEDCNSLNRQSRRVFPRRHEYDDDPDTVKLSRSSNAPADACEQVSVFLLIVSSRLKLPEEKPAGQRLITIEDLQNHLETPDLDMIVRHWLFDIKPPKPN